MQAEVELVAITPNAEKVIESAGRTCYLSLNKITDSSEKGFIQSLIKRGHLSVLEHAAATFRIRGGSRAFTHQLVRHRLASFSQQSQRYVKESGFRFVIPPSINEDPALKERFEDFMEQARKLYEFFLERDIKKEDARYILPNAVVSEIVVSANLREWRHILKLRCHRSAQWEIRQICMEILRILKQNTPSVFFDFVINSDGTSAETPYKES